MSNLLHVFRSEREFVSCIRGPKLSVQWASVGISDCPATPQATVHCSADNAPVLLAAFRLARDNQWITREQYILGRDMLIVQVRKRGESIRAVRARLTHAERHIELLTPRVHGANTIAIANVRWRQREGL